MKNLHYLHHLWLAPALAIVSARGAIAQLIEITNVRVKSTLQGLEILLESPSEKKIEFFQTVEDNRLIIDINNAHLVGGNIEQEKPIAGVNFLQVTTPTENSIRVVIVGAIAAPEIAEVTQTEEQTSFNLLVPQVAAQIDRENLSFSEIKNLQLSSTADGLKDSNIQGDIEGFPVTPAIAGVTQTKEQTNIDLLVPRMAVQIDSEEVSIPEITNVRLNSTEEELDLLLAGKVQGDIEDFQVTPAIAGVTQAKEQTNIDLLIPDVAVQIDSEEVSIPEITNVLLHSTEQGLAPLLAGNVQGDIEGFRVTPVIPGLTQTKEQTSIDLPGPRMEAQIDSAQVSISEITNVRLNSTEEGLDILLEGNVQGNIEVLQTIEENRLIININNARLVEEDIQQENPTEGVDFLQVTSPTENSIQAIVTGTLIAPEVSEVLQADGLLSINLSVVREESLIIVVTAERFEETIQDVPISITAFSEQEIEDANIDSLESIADSTPNFSFFGEGSNTGFFNTYSIRGLSNSNFLSRDTVGFFIDDVPLDYGGFLDLDLADVERIEVLRGPQNTLYGRNAQAGAINIITKKPGNTFEGKFSSEYGTYNQRRASLAITAPLDEDNLSLRLSGQANAQDGQIRNIGFGDIGDVSAANIRGTLFWLPGEDWEISLTGFYETNTNETPIIQSLDSDDLFTVEQDFDSFSRLETNSQALKIIYNNPNFQATAITTRRFTDQDTEFDTDLSPADLFSAVSDFKSTVFSQELRFQSASSNNRFQWLIGGYFEDRQFDVEGDGLRIGNAGAAIFGIPTGGFDRISAEIEQITYAAFGQVSYQPIDPLSLTVGLRYDSSTVTMDRRRNLEIEGSSQIIPLGRALNDVETDSQVLLPRFAIEYQLSPSATIYGSITQGYKPAGINYRSEEDATLFIERELSWNYEVGLKTSWFDDRLIANLAVFHNTIDNFQVSLADVIGVIRNLANAEVSITGVELELRARPVRGLDLTAGFGYTDAKYDSFFNPFTGQTLDDNKLPFAPEYTFNFAIQHRAPWGLLARAEVSILGNYFIEERNTIEQGTVTTVDATLGYEFNNYGIYLVAENITDTRFLTSGANFAGLSVATYSPPFRVRVLFKSSF